MTTCDSCQYKTKTDKYDRDKTREVPNPEPMALCKLCADTLAGNTLQYPRGLEADAILRTVCYVGNVILDEVRSLKQFS